MATTVSRYNAGGFLRLVTPLHLEDDRCGLRIIDPAFIGVADDLDAIVIAFRGTEETSIQNWIEDLFWKQLNFDYPGCEDGKVTSVNVR
ncbi:hypothetical protein L1987_23418 [Smallanthus sonchifolius]|uniref:Uncharacterized protein n=1 Tax=Smallanthus sonchifolius TaxID=185202 RepID=A0ACB9IGV1_9ASTR|nr:hypothetical protein L1987_23418 [Smallanthus sonchifolius]